jgi:two-component system KDP operon response regulator KdpE
MLVRVNLEARGYDVQEAATGSEAIALMEHTFPSLVILDLVMPGMSGDEVCTWIRERSDVPVIVLSAYNEEDLKVRALDAGADDYVTKPFAQEEFMARIRAVMRRATLMQPKEESGVVIINGLNINLKARRAFVDDKDLHLTRTEFALLAELAQNLNGILTHDELLARVWGEEYRGSSHYLHVYFGRIRKKMGEAHSTLLESVAGVGYILHAYN